MRYGPKDTFNRHEYPSLIREILPPGVAGTFPTQLWGEHRPPVNEYQALMEEVPLMGGTVMTEQEREADWLLFQQKLETAGLDEREQLVVDCIVFGGMSLVETAQYLARHQGRNVPLSKMSISRIRDAAFVKLREVFNV